MLSPSRRSIGCWLGELEERGRGVGDSHATFACHLNPLCPYLDHHMTLWGGIPIQALAYKAPLPNPFATSTTPLTHSLYPASLALLLLLLACLLASLLSCSPWARQGEFVAGAAWSRCGSCCLRRASATTTTMTTCCISSTTPALPHDHPRWAQRRSIPLAFVRWNF